MSDEKAGPCSGCDALRTERDRYRADLDKVADVFSASDAVTEGDVKLYATQPGEALANAVADILDDLTLMIEAAHCEARRAVTAEAERDRYREALTPFAHMAAHVLDTNVAPDALDDDPLPHRFQLPPSFTTVGDLRRARAALDREDTL